MNAQMIDQKTKELLLQVERNQQIRGWLLVILAAVLVISLVYVWKRWTYIPRKKQRDFFNERLGENWPEH